MAGTIVAGRAPWQRCLAELVGAFALVFARRRAIPTNALVPESVTPVGIALVFGATVGARVYTLGPIRAALAPLWLYLLRPALGAVLASRFYELPRDGPEHARSASADLMPLSSP